LAHTDASIGQQWVAALTVRGTPQHHGDYSYRQAWRIPNRPGPPRDSSSTAPFQTLLLDRREAYPATSVAKITEKTHCVDLDEETRRECPWLRACGSVAAGQPDRASTSRRWLHWAIR